MKIGDIVCNGKILTKVYRIFNNHICLNYDKTLHFLTEDQLKKENWIKIELSNKLYNLINNL